MKAKDFKKIVILTGAGISADSGLATFRDSNGLWENHRIEDVATPEAFKKDPGLVWRFYSMRRSDALKAAPNSAHIAIDKFINFCNENNKQCTLITQNVDFLHQRAQTKDYPIINMHGTLATSRCCTCGEKVFDQLAVIYNDELPKSDCCEALLRPDIVWFGEMPFQMKEIERVTSKAHLFVSIGTSGNVYPAAGLIDLAYAYQAKTACLNMEPLPGGLKLDYYMQGRAIDTVHDFFKC
jgi:NAD-dependent deacetylase